MRGTFSIRLRLNTIKLKGGKVTVKKILSILVAVSLILTSAIPAFADDTAASKGLEQAILQVKDITTIPSDYKNFQYSSSAYEENGKNISVWYMNWNNDDYSGGISATAEEGGYLISFSKYSKQKEGLGTINREAAQKKAEAFLAKVRPDVASGLKLMENTDYSNGDRHYFNYKLYKNGAIVSFVDVNVEVDKYTGDVVGYNYTGSGEDLSKLPDANGVIGLEAAQKAYMDKINVKLSYYSNYDYNKKTLTVFPAYSGANTAGKAIDAKTGDVVSLYNDFIYYGDKGKAGGMETMKNSASDSQLTQEEINAIESLTGLITKEKAESILRSAIPGLASGTKVLSTSLSKNYAEQDKYQWGIGFDGAYGVVNAKTGELMSFYVYNYDGNSKKNSGITEAQAKEKAEAYIKKTASEKFEQSRFYETPAIQVYKPAAGDVTDYSFNYYRQVNGIDLIGNGFTVIVNKATGRVTQYDCTWYDNVTFPGINNAISEEQAFKAVNDTGKMGLMYKKVDDGKVALVYDFTYPANDFLIDPVTGAKLGTDGKPYKEKALPEYTDIKGHWAEATILKLLENGYYLQGEKFNPNQKINQLNFLRYLYSPIQMYYGDEEFYKMMVNDKIIKENEKAPTAALTRQDAAKFAVRFLGQGKAAEHPEIFVNPFKDNVTDAYKGYAAICYGLKVMQGDKNGRFNGTNNVTNAEAAVIIYNALQVQ